MHRLFFKTFKIQIVYEKWIKWIFKQKKKKIVIVIQKDYSTGEA